MNRANQQKNENLSQSVFVSSSNQDDNKQLQEKGAKDDMSQQGEQNQKVTDKLTYQGIQFVTEKDYLKEDICFVCKTGFSAFYRQHHCRLCAHSVCEYCSMKRVNDTRVCDICFFKVKNLSGERRKKKLQLVIKQLIFKLIQSQKNETKKLQELDAELNQLEKIQLNSDVEQQMEMVKQNEENLKNLEAQKNQIIQEIEKQNDLYKEKLAKYQTSQAQLEQELVDQIKIVDTNIQFQQQTLDNKQSHYQLLQKQIQDKEKNDDFQKLPNYTKARDLDETNISVLLLQLDKEDSPDNYYKKEEEKVRQQLQETYGINFNFIPPPKTNTNQNSHYKTIYKEDVVPTKQTQEANIRTYNIRATK